MPTDLLFQAAAGERLTAGEAFMQHAPQGVGVTARVGLAGGHAFGSHIGPGADDIAGSGHVRIPRGAGDAEVDQVGEVVFGDQDVGRFDVTMHQADPVGGPQRRGDLLNDVDRALGLQRALGDDGLQVSADDQPHVDIQPAFDFAEMVDRHHVGVVEPGGRQRFPTEPLLECRVIGQVCGQHFHRNDTLGLGVVGTPHLAHTAAAQQLDELVAAECRTLHSAPLSESLGGYSAKNIRAAPAGMHGRID